MRFLPLIFALRELRGGARGLRVFILCITLGTFCLSVVDATKKSIDIGLNRKTAEMIGGDFSISFTYRFANNLEHNLMIKNSITLTETTEFRSMASVLDKEKVISSALVQVKGVDSKYPLYGKVKTFPKKPIHSTLKKINKIYGIVVDEALLNQLKLNIDDVVRIGKNLFQVRAILVHEPDAGANLFSYAPRVIAYNQGLLESELLGEGTMFDTRYSLRQKPNTEIPIIKRQMLAKLDGSGAIWTDKTMKIPQFTQLFDRLNTFLLFITIAGLVVGCVGVALSVKTFLESKTNTIATLKTIGADDTLVIKTYLILIFIFSISSATVGSFLGIIFPMLVTPSISEAISLPIKSAFHYTVMFRAIIYGILTAISFAIWSIALMLNISIAKLFRIDSFTTTFFPPWRNQVAAVSLLSILILTFSTTTSQPFLVLIYFGILAISLTIFLLSAFGLKKVSFLLALIPMLKDNFKWRFAIKSINGPKSDVMPVTLSLGMALLILATIGQVDYNLRNAINNDLSIKSPAFFVLDIQNSQLDDFNRLILNQKSVSSLDSAPMLRGLIKKINGVDAKKVIGDHWIIRGDRGVSFSNSPPEHNKILAGKWWDENYVGEPQISFSSQIAKEIGLSLNDSITLNVLGRNITGRITSFRDVEFSTMRINFLIIMNPSALRGAPYASIATIFNPEKKDEFIQSLITHNFPNMTVVPTRKIIARVNENLSTVASAAKYTALTTIIMALVVLIGVAASIEKGQAYDSCILKALGTPTSSIIIAFLFRSAFISFVVTITTICLACIFAWMIITYVFETAFAVDINFVLILIAIGLAINCVTGLFFVLRSVGSSIGETLRNKT